MKTLRTVLFVVLAGTAACEPQPAKPAKSSKFNVEGVWVSRAGTQYALSPSGSGLKATLSGTPAPYLTYEVALEPQKEDNVYEGSGTFSVRAKNGQECGFKTDWRVTVLSDHQMEGSITEPAMDEAPANCNPTPRTLLLVSLGKGKPPEHTGH